MTEFDRDSYETLILLMWVTGLWSSVIIACIGTCAAIYKIKRVKNNWKGRNTNTSLEELLSDDSEFSVNSVPSEIRYGTFT